MMKEGNEKKLFSSLGLAILIVIFAALFYQLLLPQSKFTKVTFFDVGQGDAALIETPSKQRILIDGGPNDVVSTKLDKETPFYQRTLDAVILTHPHADHLVGLIKVLKNYKVKTVYISGISHTTPEYLEFLSLIASKKIATHDVKSGDYLDFGEGIKLDFLFPLSDMRGKHIDNLNNSSIVSRLSWGKSSALFMGDLEKEGQDELLTANLNLKSNLYKVPHHGSKDGANSTFLSKVSPEYAVISVGKDNQFGHPAVSTLNMFKSIKVYRTDYDGDVHFSLSEDRVAPL